MWHRYFGLKGFFAADVFAVYTFAKIMANHGPSYGLDAELKAKQDAKYDANLEKEVIAWVNALVPGTNLSPGSQNVHEPLKSGVVLCQ